MNLSRRAEPLNREVRVWQTKTEIRDASEGSVRFVGDASVVDHPYTVRDMFGEFSETVVDGAFTKTLGENPDVVFLANHGGLPMARTSSKTLLLSTNPNLHAEADLDMRDPDVQKIVPKIERGDLTEMSFAFRVTRQEWNEDYTDRKILELSLHRGDVSTVTFGANPATSSYLRSDADPELEEFVAAFDALKRGDATGDQLDLLRRFESQITDLLPPVEEERTDPKFNEDLALVLSRR